MGWEVIRAGDPSDRGYSFWLSTLDPCLSTITLSASTDKGDNLDAITRGKQGASVFGAGDELTVAFHGQGAGIMLQLSHECGDGCPVGNLARLAVEFDLHRSFQNVVL